MHVPTIPALLGALFLATVVDAQANLPSLTIDVPAQKLVTYDTGEFWPGAFVLHTDGTVTAIGNPWLGCARRQVNVAGITDMARIDAAVPGDAESVAMVGGDGLKMVWYNKDTPTYEATPWPHAELQGAVAVRSAPFLPQNAVVVLTADHRTLRCYRKGGAFLGTFTMPSDVLEFDTFRHADGTPRLLVVTAAGLSCRLLDGTEQWTTTGLGGDLVRWPTGSTIKAGWVHRDPQLGVWTVALLSDSGVVSRANVDPTLGVGESLVAAFAVDTNGDGHVELLVKTSNGPSVLVNDGSNNFAAATEVALTGVPAGSVCIPDLMITNSGKRVRMVDEQSLTSIGWTNIHQIGGGGWSEGIWVDGSGKVTPPNSRILFPLAFSQDWLDEFGASGTLTTSVQILAWHQGNPDLNEVDNHAYSNVWFPLPSGMPAGEPLDVYVDLPHPIVANPELGWTGWATPDHYFLTVRLVVTDTAGTPWKPLEASEPITLGTTLAAAFRDSWAHLLQFMPTGMSWQALALLAPVRLFFPIQPTFGGNPIGVIPKIIVPPPPPTGGFSSPGTPNSPPE